MASLPTPGGDDNVWGEQLNEFLSVSLNPDGTLAPVSGPFTINVPISADSDAAGLIIRYSGPGALGAGVIIYDDNGEPIAFNSPAGGWKVSGDRNQAGPEVTGPFVSLDGTTTPPSILSPPSVASGYEYGSGGRFWLANGSPASEWVAGVTQVNDLWMNFATGVMEQCTVTGGGTGPGTWVAYVPGGTFEVPFLPESYGAVGNGTTDDTTAVQNCINAAAAVSGTNVLAYVQFRAADYLVSGLTIPPGTTLKGVNAQNYYNATTTVPNTNTLTTLKLKAASTSPIIVPNDGGANLATGCNFSDIAFNGNGIALGGSVATGTCVNLPDQVSSISRFWSFQRCYFVNSGGTGTDHSHAVYVGNQNTACTMRDCVAFNGTSGSPAGTNGIGWYGSDGRMDNCYIGYFAGAGFFMYGGTSDETFYWVGGGVFTCGFGIELGGGGFTAIGISVDHSVQDGVFMANGPASFTNCTFHTNSTGTNGANSNIKVAGNNVTLTLTGCRTAPIDTGTHNPAYMYQVTGSGVTVNETGSYNSGVAFTIGWTNYTSVATVGSVLTSPTLVGDPVAPTAAPGTNTTQLATTAFATAAGGPGGSNATAAANNTAFIPFTMDSAGPSAVLVGEVLTNFVEQPTAAVSLPNGNVAVFWRFTPSGTDASGIGSIQMGIYQINLTSGQTTMVPVVAPATVMSDTVLDIRAPSACMMDDGRIFLAAPTNNPTTGNPAGMNNGTSSSGAAMVNGTVTSVASNVLTVSANPETAGMCAGMFVNLAGGLTVAAGTTITALSSSTITLSATPTGSSGTIGAYATNPDGLTGNNRYQIGTISGNTITWGSQHTIVSGFATTLSSCYDYLGCSQPMTHASPNSTLPAGTMILCLNGSTASPGFGASSNTMTYVVGTYTLGSGNITWATNLIAGGFPAIVTGHSTGENSLAFCPNGDWIMTWRDSVSFQIYLSRSASGSTPTSGGGWVDGTWGAGAVAVTNGYSQPAMTVLTSGQILFPARDSGTKSFGLVFSSVDNGTTWSSQMLDANIPQTMIQYGYGTCLEIPNAPGLVAVFYSRQLSSGNTGGEIALRWGGEGAWDSPFGTKGATSLTSQRLQVGPMVLGGLSATPGGKNPVGFTNAQKGIAASVMPYFYIPQHPLAEDFDQQTQEPIIWQSDAASPLHDSNNLSTPITLAAGVLYMRRVYIPFGTPFQSVYIYLGAASTTGITGVFAALYNPTLVGNTATAVQNTVTASAQMKLTFASQIERGSANSFYYLGILPIGTGSISVFGQPTAQPLMARTPIGAGTSGSGLSTPPSTAGAITAVGFRPFFQLSTT